MKLNRKHFLKSIATTIGAITLSPSHFLIASENSSIKNILEKIGNTNGEKERAKLLDITLKSQHLTDSEKDILEKLYYIADRWANGFEKYANPGSEGNETSGYLCGFLNQCKIDRFFFPQLNESDPFFPLIAFYRSRMLLAHLIQNGKISMVPKNRKMYIDESVRLLKIAHKAYPYNKLIKAYLGDYRPWPELVEAHPKAPAWANHQHMVLEKLNHLIHWWVDKRQISDGQFGGGWGDDVEMWRSWVPVLFAFEDQKAIQSKEKLFEGLYGLSRMQKGYTTFLNDVEHTSEEYSDPLTCMLNMQPDNPVWEERALKVLDYIENIWTGRNDRGQLQFKSTWFNVDKVDDDPKRSCDSPYHTRLVQPLMLIWLRSGNKRIGKFIKEWLKTWVEAAFTEESGKPAGILPAAIHWPDGKTSGGKNWWEPENYHTPLYHFPSQQENMYECMLQAYYLSKDDLYLKPLRFVAEKRLQGMGDNPGTYTPGSLEWAVSELKGGLPGILIKYRLITGDKSYDSILEKDASGYEKFIFDQNIDSVSNSMFKLKESLSLPEEFYTTEVRWTDRLFAVNKKFFNYTQDKPIPSFNAGALFSSLTGSIGNFKFMPVFGVQWLTEPSNFAALVLNNSTDMFEARLFHFGHTKREMGARFFNLSDGEYTVDVSDGHEKPLKIDQTNRVCRFEVPAQKLITLKITKQN